jgi:hypothetical protein
LRGHAVSEINITLVVFAIGLGVIGAMLWLEHRPRESLQPPPRTTPFLLLGAVVALLAGVHLLSLTGVKH